MNPAFLYDFLADHRYAVVSSLSSSGIPQSALVGIAVTPQLEIVFDTLKTSRKYPNLIAHPRCSLVVGWEHEQTAQLEGIASEPSGSELRRYQEIYFGTWPEGAARLNFPQIAYLVVKLSWIRFCDYQRDLPQIEEIRLPEWSKAE